MNQSAPYDYPPGDVPAPQPVTPQPRYLPIPHAQPVWTYVLIALNLILWVVPVVLLSNLRVGGVALFERVYGNGFTTFGAMQESHAVASGEYWRMLTAMFLHDPNNILHVGFNMWALYIFGQEIEAPFGHLRFLVLYLLSGLGGSALSLVLYPPGTPELGASGAIFGLFGALIAYLVLNRRGFGEFGRRRLANAIGLIVINLVISLAPGIGLWAHLGGLLTGLALGFALAPIYDVRRDSLWGMASVVDRSSPVVRALGTLVVCGIIGTLTVLGTLLWR